VELGTSGSNGLWNRINIPRFQSEQMFSEEILAASVSIRATVTMPSAGNNNQLKTLATGFAESVNPKDNTSISENKYAVPARSMIAV
jgi:hypothetical protein